MPFHPPRRRTAASRTLPVLLVVGVVVGVGAAAAGARTTATTPKSTAVPRIIGGGAVAPGAYPHQAYIQVMMSPSTYAACGGTLIARRWIVTAAHCLTRDDGSYATPANVTVWLGKDKRSDLAADPATKYAATRVDVFPGFTTSNPVNDVAAIQLARGADLPQARLPRPGDAAAWAPGVPATAVGWGRTTNLASDRGSDQLMAVGLPIVPDDDCADEYLGYSSAVSLCAGGIAGQDTCLGDSGGPLLVGDRVLAGVVSLGPETCGAAGVPAIYSRVGADPLNTWIRERVPQVEIDRSTAQPQPYEPVTFTAAARNPGGSYDAITWDLDGDGSYDDATGPTATRSFPPGVGTVAVRATSAAGDDERRSAVVNAPQSTVSLTGGPVTVTEGQAVTIPAAKSPGAAGTMQPAAVDGVATAGTDFSSALAPVTFAAADATRPVVVQTTDDAIDEPSEDFTVAIASTSSGLIPAAPTAVPVTILDNDAPPASVASLKRVVLTRKQATLSVRTFGPGRFTVRLLDAAKPSRRVSATYTRKATRAAIWTLKVRYGKTGEGLLKRGSRSVRVLLGFQNTEGGKAYAKTAHVTAPGRRTLGASSSTTTKKPATKR